MSKIGKLPIQVPPGVSVSESGSLLNVSGPQGNLQLAIPKNIDVESGENELRVILKKSSQLARAQHGTIRAEIANMVKGVTVGWSKVLELVGTGYRAESLGTKLSLLVGYSHPVIFEAPSGISFKVEKGNITVTGIDKELVGQVAANIRAVRPPEPYKGKGIKYKDEIIRRKAGKAAKVAGAAAR